MNVFDLAFTQTPSRRRIDVEEHSQSSVQIPDQQVNLQTADVVYRQPETQTGIAIAYHNKILVK